MDTNNRKIREIVQDLLRLWAERSGDNASIGKLIDSLQQIQYYHFAGNNASCKINNYIIHSCSFKVLNFVYVKLDHWRENFET